MPPAIIAIDPGRKKCGIAVLTPQGDLLERKTLATSELLGELRGLKERYQPVKILLGGGTYSKTVKQQIKAELGEEKLELRDESYTSEKARKRYFAYNPPRGWKKLLPEGMRVPDRPYDDFAALVMAEEYLKEKLRTGKGKKNDKK